MGTTQHVDEPVHRNNLRSNKFSKFILEVELTMKQQIQKEPEAIDFPLEIMSKLTDETN